MTDKEQIAAYRAVLLRVIQEDDDGMIESEPQDRLASQGRVSAASVANQALNDISCGDDE